MLLLQLIPHGLLQKMTIMCIQQATSHCYQANFLGIFGGLTTKATHTQKIASVCISMYPILIHTVALEPQAKVQEIQPQRPQQANFPEPREQQKIPGETTELLHPFQYFLRMLSSIAGKERRSFKRCVPSSILPHKAVEY